jgi:hypothetical protein
MCLAEQLQTSPSHPCWMLQQPLVCRSKWCCSFGGQPHGMRECEQEAQPYMHRVSCLAGGQHQFNRQVARSRALLRVQGAAWFKQEKHNCL